MSLQTLRTIPFLADLDQKTLESVWDSGESLKFPAGTTIFHEGELGEYFYIILTGVVSIQKARTSEQSIEITQLKAGQFFGEMALLDAGTRSASVVSVTDCECLRIDQKTFIQLLSESNPLIILELVAVITRHIRATSKRVFEDELARQKLEADMQIERHRALAQMVAGVAHEINTPLGIINTAAGLMSKRLNTSQIQALVADDRQAKQMLEDVDEAAQLIMNNIQRAHKLVQDFKKISVNQVTDSLETIGLLELVQSTIDLYKINARQANLHIEIINELPSQAKWEGYSASMTQVLLNLLSNIERYAYDSQGGVIHIILSTPQAETFSIVVRDKGKGIAEENLAHIFDPFFTTGRGKGGTGLGMTIVYNLVTSMFGGVIHIDSTLGQGTTVTIMFPYHAPPHTL